MASWREVWRPGFGNAIAQGDKGWIRRIHRKLVVTYVVVYSLLAIGMTLFGHAMFRLWVGPAAAPSTLLIAAVALCFLVRDWTGIHSALLNGLNVVRPQVWNVIVTAVLTIVFDLILIRPFGPTGLALGSFAAFVLSSGWYFPWLARKALTAKSSGGSEL